MLCTKVSMKKCTLSLALLLLSLFGTTGASASPLLGSDLNKDGKIRPYENKALPLKMRIDDLMRRLSIQEKVDLVVGSGGYDPNNPVVGASDSLVPGAAGTTAALPRHGIPSIVMTDGPAGVRISPNRKGSSKTFYVTAFPIGTALASTWDEELVDRVGRALADEAMEYGSDVQLTPGMNIMRNPLCGRNFEYFSEDPVQSGKIAAALIKGIQHKGVAASAKHFAANNSESNRMRVDSSVSQRALREIYLRTFEIAIEESNPATVMTSYNKLNGVYTSASEELLTRVLREEWGYEGLVMSDWFGGFSIQDVKTGRFEPNIAWQQIAAGNDLLMPGLPQQKQNIMEALKQKKLSQEALNRSARRVLKLIFQSPKMNGHVFGNQPDLNKHAPIAREAAAEGMILLKNDRALPLLKAQKAALFGTTSYHFIAGGTGSGFVNKAYVVSLADGLKKAKHEIDADLEKRYRTFMEKDISDILKSFGANSLGSMASAPELKIDQASLEKSAEEQDVAIVTIGRISGEMRDRKLENDFNLTADEAALIKEVSEAFRSRNKKIAVVLNVGGVVETASWKDEVDAILLAWQPGQEGGDAVTDVLIGKVNPSGKLTMTFPMKYADVPSSATFPGTPADQPIELFYEDGIYVGYRYYDTFGVDVSYEFGHGLSYTNFEYSRLELSGKEFKDAITATINIKNTGTIPGREVVQLYLSAPCGDIDKPVQELKRFGKTKLLQPGESQILSFKLSAKDLASFYPTFSAWVADQGEYVVRVGASASDIRQKQTFTLPLRLQVEKVGNVLNRNRDFDEIKAKMLP